MEVTELLPVSSVPVMSFLQSVFNKRLRWLYLSTVVLVLSVTLFMFIYSHEGHFPPWLHYGRTSSTKNKLHADHVDCPRRQMVVEEHNPSIFALSGSRSLLISAYLEHRSRHRQVRVISVALRNESLALHCFFCCQSSLHRSKGSTEVHSDHFGFAFGTADIMCPVPSACKTPTHITVSAKAFPQIVDDVCSAGAHDTPPDESSLRFLEVKNQQATAEPFRYNFTVCLSTMFDYTNVLQLVQTLEMMQLLGVNKVAVYKSSCNLETQQILDYYVKKGLVELIRWSVPRLINVSRSWLPGRGPGELHYFGQLAALNDCLYRYMYQSRYLSMQDSDELILPQKVDSWSELIPSLEKKHGGLHCYKFESYVFPTTVGWHPQPSVAFPRSLWVDVAGVNILEHVHHEPPSLDTSTNFKIILNPRTVFSVTVHGTLTPNVGCHWVDKNVAHIYHIRAPKRKKLRADQLIYNGRLLKYGTRLTHAVTAVFQQSQLHFKNC